MSVNPQKFKSLGYEVLCHVQARVGDKPKIVGSAGVCRFCDEARPGKFRNVAHAIPEGLGNHWLISVDECDTCNILFSRYDDALCASVGAILTLSATKGKKGVRKTGKSGGASRIFYDADSDGSHISFQFPSAGNPVEYSVPPAISFSSGGETAIRFPTPAESFVPRLAYKALAKIGLAILPPEQLIHFSKLRAWTQILHDEEEFPFLDVGISIGSIEKAPQIAAATVLRSFLAMTDRPKYILLVTAGSICWQIDLMSDDEQGLVGFGCVNIPWSVMITSQEESPVKIEYSKPMHFDWSLSSKVPVPVIAVCRRYNEETNDGNLEVVWRPMLPADNSEGA